MDKKYFLVIAFLALLILAFAILISTNKNEPVTVDLSSQNIIPSATISPTVEPVATTPAQKQKDVTELTITDERVGTGEEAVPGKTITVNYAGTLTNGTKFDSSYDRGQPFTFNLGEGRVIQGWEQGFTGMKVGGKRKLVIPSSLGYGEEGNPPAIPGNATLIFEVELLKVE